MRVIEFTLRSAEPQKFDVSADFEQPDHQSHWLIVRKIDGTVAAVDVSDVLVYNVYEDPRP